MSEQNNNNENNTATEQPQSKFKLQLILVVLATIFIPMIILGYSFFDQWANMGKTEGTGEVGRVAVKVADAVDRELSNQVGLLRALASTKDIETKLTSASLPPYWDGVAILSGNNIGATSGKVDINAAKELASSYNSEAYKGKTNTINSTILHRGNKDIVLFCSALPSGKYIVSQIDFLALMDSKALSFQKKNKAFDIYIISPKGDVLYQINNTGDPSKTKLVSDIADNTIATKILSMNQFAMRVKETSGNAYVYGAFPSKMFGEFQGLRASYVLKVPSAMVQERNNPISGFLLLGVFTTLLLLIYYSISFKQSVTGKAPQTNKKWYE